MPYAAGELIGEGCDAQGNPVARYAIPTTGAAVRLRATLLSQTPTLAQVLVEAVDSADHRARMSMAPVTCTLDGSARLLGMENALNFDMTAPQSPVKMLGQGRLVAYIALLTTPATDATSSTDATPATDATPDAPAPVTVTFTAEGMEPAQLTLRE